MDWQIKSLVEILPSFKNILTTSDLYWRHWLINWNNLDKKNDSIPISDWEKFNMRYREAFGNRLISAYLSRKFNEEIVFREYTIPSTWFETDGVIHTKNNDELFLITEHVIAYSYKSKIKWNELLIDAMYRKFDKWKEYMNWKVLIVFLEWVWERNPKIINEKMRKDNFFFETYLISKSFTDINDWYRYSIVQLYEKYFEYWKIYIQSDFNTYFVTGELSRYL